MTSRRDNTLTKIAATHLHLESLETTKSGADFQEQARWTIKAALEAAYEAGYAEARKAEKRAAARRFAPLTAAAIDTLALWDEHGLGDDDRISEPIYDALKAGIDAATTP